MRFLVITDLHQKRSAIEWINAEIDKNSAEFVLFLGDITDFGTGEEAAEIISSINAKTVFVLPNNGNVILAAQQAATLSDKNVIVLPTKNVAMGIAAVVAFQPDLSGDENEANMREAAEHVHTASITYAVRDTTYEDREIHQGDIMGMIDNKLSVLGDNIHKVGAIGKPGYKWEAKIVDAEGSEVKQGEVGELIVKGDGVMTCYYKNPEVTAEVFTEDGWFRTKDIAKIDEDGYIYIKGRVNSMIVGPSGENIYPEEIEHVLNSNSLVAESIVTMEEGRLVALVNFNREELERRYLDLKDDFTEKMEEVKKEVLQYVNSQVSKFSRISEVEEVEEFQKTPSMKIKRFLYNARKKNENK